MGLDNGVVFRTKEPITYPKWVMARRFIRHENGGEVCYWRRCWGLREDVFNMLGSEHEEKFEYHLTIDEVRAIRKILVGYFFHPRRWRKSAWEWKDAWRHQFRHILSLRWLEKRMRRDPDNIEWVIFYDSY